MPVAPAATMPTSPSDRRRPPEPAVRCTDEFTHLRPLLDRFARLAVDDPRRAALREQLARGYLPVVRRIARRYRDRGEPVADLEQSGALGLLRALDRFDPDRGADFLPYAIATVTGEIRRHFRDRTWSVHVPRRLKEMQAGMAVAEQALSYELGRAPRVSELATRLGLPREEVIEALRAQQSYNTAPLDLPACRSGTPLADLLVVADTAISRVDARETLRPVIEGLPDRERTILSLRFVDNMSQTEIAHQVGISQMHVSRLLHRTLATLRSHMVT